MIKLLRLPPRKFLDIIHSWLFAAFHAISCMYTVVYSIVSSANTKKSTRYMIHVCVQFVAFSTRMYNISSGC